MKVSEDYIDGEQVTYITLTTTEESHALAALLHAHYWDVLKADQNGWPLQGLYDALVPTDEDDGYEEGE